MSYKLTDSFNREVIDTTTLNNELKETVEDIENDLTIYRSIFRDWENYVGRSLTATEENLYTIRDLIKSSKEIKEYLDEWSDDFHEIVFELYDQLESYSDTYTKLTVLCSNTGALADFYTSDEDRAVGILSKRKNVKTQLKKLWSVDAKLRSLTGKLNTLVLSFKKGSLHLQKNTVHINTYIEKFSSSVADDSILKRRMHEITQALQKENINIEGKYANAAPNSTAPNAPKALTVKTAIDANQLFLANVKRANSFRASDIQGQPFPMPFQLIDGPLENPNGAVLPPRFTSTQLPLDNGIYRITDTIPFVKLKMLYTVATRENIERVKLWFADYFNTYDIPQEERTALLDYWAHYSQLNTTRLVTQTLSEYLPTATLTRFRATITQIMEFLDQNVNFRQLLQLLYDVAGSMNLPP